MAPRSTGGRTVASNAAPQGAKVLVGRWAYTIAVNPLRQFDQFEVNDTFDSATQIRGGATLEANIMDPSDDDFYAVFERLTRLRLQPASSTLALIVSLFTESERNGYLTTETAAPGTPIELTLPAGVRFIKVESISPGGGPYTLAIQ